MSEHIPSEPGWYRVLTHGDWICAEVFKDKDGLYLKGAGILAKHRVGNNDVVEEWGSRVYPPDLYDTAMKFRKENEKMKGMLREYATAFPVENGLCLFCHGVSKHVHNCDIKIILEKMGDHNR